MRLMSEISEGVFTTLLKTSLENLPEKGEKMKHLETNYIKQSELCAQTRASSLTGGMPVW